MSISENPMFGVMIGQQIGNNASAEAAELRLTSERDLAESRANGATNALLGAAQGILQLRQNVQFLADEQANLCLVLAGVRGVTREILNELSKADPNNPLLEKKVRDRIWEQARNEQAARQNDKDVFQIESESANYRDAAYGASSASKGGPEKDQITANTAVRTAAEVPAGHITDRERFLALIEKLATELKAANPDAAILQDKEMVGVFEDYALHEEQHNE